MLMKMNRKQASLSVDTLELLKVKILKSAVEGKLVPQLDEEPEVEQIGEIPKEVPFEIPSKWKWVRSTELISLIRGVTFPRAAKQVSKIDNSYVRCLTTGSIQEEYKSDSDVFIPSTYIKNGKQRLKRGDVVISSANSRELVGKSILWNGLDDTFGGFLTVARRDNELIHSNYLHLVFRFLFLSGFFRNLATQTTNIANLSNKILEALFFPLPPLEEQRRIVEKLGNLFSNISAIQKSMKEVSRLSESFEKQLLQSAISGKLVPQLDGESEVEQIGQAPQEAPFEIPKKWKWVSLGEIAKINPSVSLASKNTDLSFVPMKAVSPGYSSRIENAERISFSSIKQGYSKFINGDLLLAKITPCFQNRKSVIAQGLIKSLGCGSTEFHVLRASEGVDPKFLLLFLKSEWFISYGVEHFKGTAGQQRLNATDLKKCPFPLPPLNEQKRIVEKLDNLMLEIQKLK